MIKKLTKEQEAKVIEYRQRYFNQATSTERADRERAEVAARRLMGIKGVKINEVFLVDSPQEGKEKYDLFRGLITDSLRGFFNDSLEASLWNSLSGSLSYSFWALLNRLLMESLRNSLWRFLRRSSSDSFWALLRGSLWDSLWDTGSVAFAIFVINELGVEIGDEEREKLHLINEILASCFALWIVPGMVILCDRPRSVDVQEGKLVNMEW